MLLHAEAFWLPKGGSSEAEYEDAFWPSNLKLPQGYKDPRVRFAVADGASEASFSKQWAKQLVRGFVHGKLGVPVTEEELRPLQDRWRETVHRRPLPWYAEEKAEKGAFSSLLGLEVVEASNGGAASLSWRAVAVGDSCLFQVEQGQLLKAWPITSSTDFGNSPSLLSSKPECNGVGLVGAAVQKIEGECARDSAFYLMTDALSCWFLREQERGGEPWRVVTDLGTDAGESFRALVTGLRTRREMRNDDVTLVRIDVLA